MKLPRRNVSREVNVAGVVSNARPKGLVRLLYESAVKTLYERVNDPRSVGVLGTVLAIPRFMDATIAEYKVNKDRFTTYTDIWTMIEDSPSVQKSLEQFIMDAVAEPFSVKCDDKEGQRIIEELLDRINYWSYRHDCLMRLLAMGDVFVQRELGAAYGPKRNTELWTSGISILPEWTMFRNTNFLDKFTSVERAYRQIVPARAFEVDMFGEGMWLPLYQICHGRWNRFGHRFTRYGLSYFASDRIAYNVYYAAMRNAAIARQNNAYDKDVWKLGTPERPVTETKKLEEWKTNNVDNVKEGPLTTYVVSGNVDLVQKKPVNAQLQNIADINAWREEFKVGLPYPMELLGIGIGTVGVSEGELGMLMEVLQRRIGWLLLMEETEIVRPIVEFELALHGKFVEFDIVNQLARLEERNKRSKRHVSEIQTHMISRETAWNISHRELGTWEDEEKKILAEIEKGMDVTGAYQAPGESLSKGKKGVTKKDTAAQGIPDEYGTD